MIKSFNALLTLDLQYFASEIPPTDAPETTPNGDTPEETNLESSDTPVEPTKTFTQAELDDIVADRLKRDRKKYADYDDLKTKASEYEAKLEAQRLAELSEVERAQEQAKQYESQLAELQSQVEAKEKAIREQAIKNEFIKVATGANIVDIDAAIALSDLTAVSIDESGAVVGVADVIKSLVDNKPYMVAKKQAQPIGQASNISQAANEKTDVQLLSEAAEKARTSGLAKDKVAYAQLKKQLGK